MVTRFHSPAISKSPQVCFDGLLQFRGLGELGVQFGDQARHLFLEGVTIVLNLLGPNITTGRENMAVCGDLSGGRGLAETGDILIILDVGF
jgi:hypothetical protein